MKILLQKLVASILIVSSFLLFTPMPVYAVGGIARDATSANLATGTSVSVNHTITGTNTILIATLAHGGNEDVTCTYNGVSMTSAHARIFTNRALQVFYLINPTSGTHSLSCSWATSGFSYLEGASYTGTKQSGQPDSSNSGSATTGATITLSTTVVASNSWLVAGYLDDNGGTVTAGAGTSINIQQADAHAASASADSNGIVGTGVQSLAVNESGTGNNKSMIILSIAPAPTTAAFNFWQFFDF